jgi:hypothetical protein
MAQLADRLEQLLSTPFSFDDEPLKVWPTLTVAPASRRDRFLTLLRIYDLHAAGPHSVDESRWATHPAVAAVKLRLEHEWIAELDEASNADELAGDRRIDPVQAMRSLAARDRLPEVYHQVARDVSLLELRRFIAVEGGPDGGFDDLVAVAQIGLHGSAKQELAQNYWDEMGDGDPREVHTDLYEQMIALLDVPLIPRAELPEAALERSALGGLLATNRWLQPEMIGALGLIELQAGPRCRLVLQGFERLGLPEAAQRFYAVHADVDPRHGKDWLEKAVAPLAEERPDWRPRIVRGARWRWAVNKALFDLLDPRSSDLVAA